MIRDEMYHNSRLGQALPIVFFPRAVILRQTDRIRETGMDFS
jgi:hypothetical protein